MWTQIGPKYPQQITAGIISYWRGLASWLLTVGDHLHQNVFDLKTRLLTLAYFPDWGLANHRQRGYTTSAVVWRD